MFVRLKWIVSGAVLAAIAITGGALVMDARQQRAEEMRIEQQRLIAENQRLAAEQIRLEQQARQLEEEKRQLTQVVDRLNVEQRVAWIDILQQHRDARGHVVQTILRMTEIGRDGEPLEPMVFGVAGAVPHFDALVVKFSDEYVAGGDQLRGKSLALFRRVYGESQAPEDGYWLGERGSVPDVYRVSPNPSEFELTLWKDFWSYADDPELARAAGVRVAQGEAVYAPVAPGERWILTLEADGGLNLIKQDASAKSPGGEGSEDSDQRLHAPSPLDDDA